MLIDSCVLLISINVDPYHLNIETAQHFQVSIRGWKSEQLL